MGDGRADLPAPHCPCDESGGSSRDRLVLRGGSLALYTRISSGFVCELVCLIKKFFRLILTLSHIHATLPPVSLILLYCNSVDLAVRRILCLDDRIPSLSCCRARADQTAV